MAKPNTDVSVHRCFFIKHEQKAKEALIILLQKESLDNYDIQAIKILTEMLEAMVNPLRENNVLLSVIHNNDDPRDD